MDEPTVSNWERGARKGPRPLVLVLLVVLLLVACIVGLVILIFNSPGASAAREIYDGAPGVVVQWNYFTGTNGDTMNLVLAPHVTREEAIDLECRVVLPLLSRERLSTQIVIWRADNEYQLNGDECPPSGAA